MYQKGDGKDLTTEEGVRINYAVKAIQHLLAYIGHDPRRYDGVFHWLTKRAVKKFQTDEGLVSDGVVGPHTAERLVDHLVDQSELELTIPKALVKGLLAKESSIDFGAVGYVDHNDLGLAQYNLIVNGRHLTAAECFDAFVSVPDAAQDMHTAALQYDGKGTSLMWHCAVAHHNSPVEATQWYQTGNPPNSAIAAYVQAVFDYAAADERGTLGSLLYWQMLSAHEN
jgi:hypothetical protein